MSQQKVRPDLLTFNSVLKSLKRCGSLARSQALQVLNEMKALGIGDYAHTFHTECVCGGGALSGKSEIKCLCMFVCVFSAPSLASFNHLLAVFYKACKQPLA